MKLKKSAICYLNYKKSLNFSKMAFIHKFITPYKKEIKMRCGTIAEFKTNLKRIKQMVIIINKPLLNKADAAINLKCSYKN